MKEKKTEIILGIILTILIIIMVVLLFVNSGKRNEQNYISDTKETQTTSTQISETQSTNTNQQKIEKLEEKNQSMQSGALFCKIEDTIVYYEEKTKSIYTFNNNENKGSKIGTLESGANKIYFDGQNIYAIPSYYKGRGIYKIDLQGKVEKIYEQASLQLWLTDDQIYFVKQIGFDEINQNPQGTLCVMNKDGSGVTEIAQNVKNDFFIQNDKIYYTTQNRKMYEIKTDGTNQVQLTEGRRFVLNVSEQYLLYIDYGDQEAYHILNLETKEDTVIGKDGFTLEALGNTYVNINRKIENGTIETEPTFMKIEKDGKVTEVEKIVPIDDEILYVTEKKIYASSKTTGNYQIDIETKQKENVEELKECKYYVGNKAYEVNTDTNGEMTLKTVDLK